MKNRTGGPILLPLPGDYPADFIVETPDGTALWWLTHGKVIRSFETLRRLDANEELTFEATWNLLNNDGQAVVPGDYFVRGILKTKYPFKMETGQALRITP